MTITSNEDHVNITPTTREVPVLAFVDLKAVKRCNTLVGGEKDK